MTTKELHQVIEQYGYIVHYESNKYNICEVYDHAGQYVGKCHINAAQRLRAEDTSVKTWDSFGTTYFSDYRCKRYVDYENRDHCRRIADELDEYATGKIYRCPDCDEVFTIPDDVGDKFCCPCCQETNDVDDFEQCSIHDYLDDILDIEYRCNREKEYKSVQICVAWGGPSIYLDTASCNVELYWWGDRADWPMSSDAVEAIDNWAEEYFGCI